MRQETTMIDGLEPGDVDTLARIRNDIYECGHADREEGDEHALDRILAALEHGALPRATASELRSVDEKAQAEPQVDFERMVQWAHASARERLAIPDDVRETLREVLYEADNWSAGALPDKDERRKALAWLDAAPR